MALTIEPGIYIPAGSKGVARKWWDIGIRIEDDVIVTKEGCDVLSKDAPKGVEEIEALMSLKQEKQDPGKTGPRIKAGTGS
jgi:Xaa-Pro aminopeptidase